MESLPPGPFANLRTVYPTFEAWETAEPADMAGVLLRDLANLGSLSAHNVVATFRDQSSRMRMADYQRCLGPLLEAYAWLQHHGLIAPSPSQPSDFDILTRRAKRILSTGDFENYRRAQLTLYDVLDSKITQKVWGIYLRGDYDIAIAYAFKVVEVLMRERAGLPTSDYGERLVKKFFQQFEPPEGCSDSGLSATESLFIGALKRYRNEAVHEPLSIQDPSEALEILVLANHCLRIVDNVAAP